MKKYVFVFLLSLTAMSLAGCASFSTPERPAYSGTDNVNSAQANQLIGTWRVVELNPIANSKQQPTVIEYRADGSVIGTIKLEGEEFAAVGPLEFELTGQWMLDADTVTHADITMKSKSDSEIGSLLSSVINDQKGISGQANIYELSNDRIVMLGSDGAAMEYIRQ